MPKYKILLFLCLTLCNNLTGQEVFNPTNYDFKCSGKLVLPAQYETLYIYDGDDPNIATIERIEKVTIGTKWEKKKADGNCQSSDPRDCLVWCLVEEKEDRISYVVADTSSTTEWHKQTDIIRPEGQEKKLPVLCKDQLTPKLLTALRDKLYALDYVVDPEKRYTKLKGRLNKEFKQFQYDYELPVGKWTVETMEFLYSL